MPELDKQKSHNTLPWLSSEPLEFLLTKCQWCCHYVVNNFQDHHNRYPMAHPSGRYMRHHLWVENLINVFRHYRILTTDTPWLVCKGDTWGDLCEFKFWLMYYITTGSSQQTSHGSPQGQHMGRLLQVQILIDALYHYRILTADTPRIVGEDNTWGVLCEFKFWLIYQITTGPS